MAAKADTSAFWSPSGWLNLQGAKFKYLKDKVHIINSVKLIQEIEKFVNKKRIFQVESTTRLEDEKQSGFVDSWWVIK